jgi:CHAT domain-containing protein
LNEAKKLALQFHLSEADAILADLIREDARNTSALRLYGEVLADRGNFRRADSIFASLNTLGDDTSGEFRYHRARVKLGLGHHAAADSLIQMIIDTANFQPDNVLLSRAYNIRGLIEFTNGQYDAALTYQARSLDLGREAGNLRCEADAMRQIGVVLWYRGHLDSALLQFYNRALELYREAGDKLGEATTVSNIGLVHGTRGDWKTNLQHQLSALEMRKGIGDHKGLVDSYYFLTSFIPRSDHGRAFAYSYLKKAYALAQRTGYVWGAEIASRGLRDIAIASAAVSDLVATDDDSLFESSAEAKVNALQRKAAIAKKARRWAEAARGYDEVIRTLDSLKYHAGIEASLVDYAEVLSMLGEHRRAEQSALRAVRHTRSINHHQGEVESQLALGSVLHAAGKMPQAISLLETLTRDLDSAYINTLINSHPMFAFEIAAAEAHKTRGRAYALLIESLAEARQKESLFESMERERLLPFWGEREGGGLRTGGEKSPAYAKLVQLIQDAGRENHSRTARQSLQTSIGEIYQYLLAQQSALSSSSSSLALSSSTSVAQLQQSLSPRQVFAGYHLSDSALSVLVVRKDRAEIFQKHLAIDDVHSVIDVLLETVQRGRLDPSNDFWKGPARYIYALLVQPLFERGLLHAGDHLIVSPHRSLFLVPFANLVSHHGNFLLDSVTISYALSATQFVNTPRASLTSARSLLAFAPDDESLPYVHEEIAAIPNRVFHPIAVLSKKDATTGRLFKEWSNAGAIHIASHGAVNSLYPLYSTISCSDRNLELREILKAKFQARFVLLSACETGRTVGTSGKIPDGHDMVSFPRAFLSAGAMSVISPLWLVEDRATAKFVALFYEELAEGATSVGARPTAWSEPNRLAISLNEAQRRLKAQPSTSHPFFWAGFTLTGSP